MTDPSLQIYLLAFMIVTTWLMLFWKQIRKLTPFSAQAADADQRLRFSRLKRISKFYWITFSLFGIMTIVYAAMPKLYFVFLPLDVFHHPVINQMGLLILKIAVVWIVIAQLSIDKEIYKYSRDIESLSAMELVNYSERMLIMGMTVLFIGYVTTITNVVGFILVLMSIVQYIRIFVLKNIKRREIQ